MKMHYERLGWVLLLVVSMLWLLGAADPQGKTSFNWVVTKKLSVTNDSSYGGLATFSDDVTFNDPINVNDTLTITNRALWVRLQDAKTSGQATGNVLAETAYISTQLSISSTALTQTDYPRNLMVALTSEGITATAGPITVTGVDLLGRSATEYFSMGAISGTQYLTGSVAWTTIQTLTFPTRASSLSVTLSLGQKLGLPLLPRATSDVYLVRKNNAVLASYTVSTTYGTVDVGAISANDDFTFGVKQ
jgi:hypothetical protein